jgi:tetratricopeptide (TPR) repeat protein
MRMGVKPVSPALALVALASCAMFDKPEQRRVVVPDELLKQSDYEPDGYVPRQRYVVRMSDGQRDWEVEFPEAASGYEIRIPLEGEPKILGQGEKTPVSAADRAIADDMVRQNPELAGKERSKDGVNGERDLNGEGGGRKAPKVSYLASLVELRELYRTRNYEVALMKVVELERDYPNDDKVLAMKGSLYRQIGRTELAREAWEQALRINPTNQVVIDALSRLPATSAAPVIP